MVRIAARISSTAAMVDASLSCSIEKTLRDVSIARPVNEPVLETIAVFTVSAGACRLRERLRCSALALLRCLAVGSHMGGKVNVPVPVRSRWPKAEFCFGGEERTADFASCHG